MQALIVHLLQDAANALRPGVWDRAAAKAGLPAGRASIEDMDDGRITAALQSVSEELEMPMAELLEVAGRKAVVPLAEGHMQMFEHFDHPFDLLGALEPLVHASLRTTGNRPPLFGFVRKTSDHAVLRYESQRRLGHLAVGMTRGVLDWYKVDGEVTCADASGERADINIHLASTA